MLKTLTSIVIGGVSFILIGVAIAFGPTMLQGFESMRTSDGTDVDTASVTTTGYGQEDLGFTSDTSFLSLGLSPVGGFKENGMYATSQDTATIALNYDITGVNTITSNVAADSPSSSSYTGDDLTVTGLQADEDRTLTVNYSFGAIVEGVYTGLDPVLRFGPTAILLGFILVVGFAGFMGIKMVNR